MGKTSRFSVQVVNEFNGKVHNLQGIGWYSFDKDLVIVADLTANNQYYVCNRLALLEAETLADFEKTIVRS